jgi:integrase/recombinase XerC
VINVIGKRTKQRYIPIVDELRQALESYFSYREQFLGSDSETETALFLDSKTKKRLTYYRLSVIVKKLLSLVTMQSKRSPHVLRHSFATSLLNHSANLQAVKELLGHESVTTTAIYTHLTFEELRKMYNHAHPRA